MLTSMVYYTKMKLVIDMKMDNEWANEQPGREIPEDDTTMRATDEKEKDETVKKERCEPCMHCGYHCIFLKED